MASHSKPDRFVAVLGNDSLDVRSRIRFPLACSEDLAARFCQPAAPTPACAHI